MQNQLSTVHLEAIRADKQLIKDAQARIDEHMPFALDEAAAILQSLNRDRGEFSVNGRPYELSVEDNLQEIIDEPSSYTDEDSVDIRYYTKVRENCMRSAKNATASKSAAIIRFKNAHPDYTPKHPEKYLPKITLKVKDLD